MNILWFELAQTVRNPGRLRFVFNRDKLRKKINSWREPLSVASILSGSKTRLSIDGRGTVRAGNQWDNLLVEIVREFEQAPMSFLRQPVISRTIHPNQQDLARDYLSELRTQPFFREHILPRLHDVPMGNPYLCTIFPFVSPTTIQHAYFLSMMKEKFGIFPPDGGIKHFLHIGGGYGNLCRIIKEFGYSGRYVIADLPEMHAIQRHFLAHALPVRSMGDDIEFRTLTDVGIFPEQGPSLLFATFSLSEMPMETRRALEPHYSRFDYLFFVYNRAFDGVDNIAYFTELAETLSKGFRVRHFKDPHRRAWFLLCDRTP